MAQGYPTAQHHLRQDRHAAAVAGKCVMRSLGDEPDITSVSLEQQMKVLFREPLAELARNGEQTRTFVLVVDALDESGDDASREKLA